MSEITDNEFYYSGTLDDIIGTIEEAVTPDEPIITEGIQHIINNPPFIQEMIDEIDRVNTYAWNRGSMGFDMGIESLNKAFRGLNPGLHLVAGGANTGKSMLLLRIMWNVVLLNQYRDEDHPREAFGLYFSLDDTNEELMPRIVAMDQGVTINQVLFPKAVKEPVILEKRDAGLERLKDNVQHFAMRDADDGTTIEYIEQTIEEYTNQLENLYPGRFQLVVFVDNFHDIDVAKEGYSEDIVRFDYVASHLTDIANKYLIPVMCSAEFRKISAHKRPSEDDIKSSGKIAYESKAIILLYNEVGISGDNASVYWELTDSDHPDAVRKMPVLEMHVSKNKFNSFKGREFLRFIPEMANFYEISDEEAQAYRQMMSS